MALSMGWTLSFKESKPAHSLQKNPPETTNQGNTTSAAARPSTRPRRTRTSHNYAALHSGSNQTWSETPESYTEIAAHSREDHRPEDYTFKLITTEEGWRKRTLKEALMIQKEDPERLLNENQGKHIYAHIYRLRTRPEAEKVFQAPESTANFRTESFDERPPWDANFWTSWKQPAQNSIQHWRWQPVRQQKHVWKGKNTLFNHRCQYKSLTHLPSLNQLNDMLKIPQINDNAWILISLHEYMNI